MARTDKHVTALRARRKRGVAMVAPVRMTSGEIERLRQSGYLDAEDLATRAEVGAAIEALLADRLP